MSLHQAPTTDEAWAGLLGPATDAATEGLMVLDADGTIRAANVAASVVLGTTRRVLLGAGPRDPRFRPLRPDGTPLPRHEHPILVALDTGTPQRDVHLGLDRHDGAVQWHSWNAVPLFSEGSSRPYGVVASFFDITTHVEQGRELRLLTEHSGDIIAVHDIEGRITYATGAAEALVGIAPQHLVGLNVLDVCHHEDVPAVRAAEEAAHRGETSLVAYRVRHVRTGEWIWLESHVRPVDRHASDAHSAVIVTRDITDRRAAEDAARDAAAEARRQQALLEEAAQMAALGSWGFDVETGESWFSPSLCRIFGLDPAAEPAPGIHQDLVHAEDKQRVRDVLRAAARDGTAFETSYRLIRPDGAERIMHSRGAQAEDRGRTWVWGTTQDVTDLHELEAGRREAERLFRAAFERAPIGLCLTQGRDGRLLRANPAMAELLGYPIEELVGMRLADISHPDDLESTFAAVEPMLRGEADEVRFEKRYLRRDGGIVWTMVSCAAVAGDDGGIPYSITQVVDITERKRFEGQLQHLADHDALTGLFNRRRFEEELERVLAEAERYGRRGAVVVLDLDGFKYVNDTLGHSAGDELISRLSTTLRGELRETDVLARLGGDEFGVIVPEADAREAEAVAAKLLRAVERDGLVSGGSRHARVTASAGVATYEGGDGLSAEELLVEADIAMYDAKEAGRNRSAVHERTHAGAGRHVSRLTWLERIRSALGRQRFELHAQPIHALGEGDGVERFELLVRMRGDDGELVPPAAFLHVAERFDVIQDIDRWVVARAVDLVRREHDAGHAVTLGVNLAGRTVGDAAFGAWLEDLLAHRPVPRGRLVFEITETAAVVNLERARVLGETLRRLGCRLALDDFGTGFASFAYLKHLPFDCLKIDGEYVRGLADNPADRLVVEAVVTIARGMGAVTLAEFVTDGDVLEQVRALGVDFAQGFHLGRPVPVEDALRGIVHAP
ncbi:MAG: EAL domain-containing protein [Solirubrobacterales bacterium]|nr:EAL domain-containing protein [Solirubrobacterales bacterium]